MKIVCETVKDLVPQYLDGTCSSLTGKFVKKHMKRCKSCSEYYSLCKHSKEMSEKRMKENSGDKDLVYVPDDGYELIARRVGKSIMIERISIISAAVAAIVTVIILLNFKNKKDR